MAQPTSKRKASDLPESIPRERETADHRAPSICGKVRTTGINAVLSPDLY